MNLNETPIGWKAPQIVKMVVEIPKNSNIKLEYKQDTESFQETKKLSIPTPTAYGFICGTKSEDGDPLDIFILGDQPYKTGDIIDAKPIGLIYLKDKGLNDNKIIAVSAESKIEDLNAVNPTMLKEITKYLLQDDKKIIEMWTDKEQAYEEINKCTISQQHLPLSEILEHPYKFIGASLLAIGVPLLLYWLRPRK